MKSYNIIYSADDTFAEILGISVYSLLLNNEDANAINVVILDLNISKKNKDMINYTFDMFKRTRPRFEKALNIEKILNINVQTDRGSISQFSRLFISNIFTDDIEKVLYLDCDTIINSSIEKLWDTDLTNYTIGAVKDAFSKYYRENIGLNSNDVMFNSGVMLINLKRWKKQQIESQLKKFILGKNGKVPQGDQGALNGILSGDTLSLDLKYNLVSIIYTMTYDEMFQYRKPVNFYNKKEIETAKSDPVIIHYTSGFNTKRPWMKECKHPLTPLWISIKNKSLWKNVKLIDEKSSVVSVLYKKIPKSVAIRIASIFQVYLRPLKVKVINSFLDTN